MPRWEQAKFFRSDKHATGKPEPVDKKIIPFPIQEREPLQLLKRELNRIPVFERLPGATAPSQARDADRIRIPVAWANLKGTLGKFRGLRPVTLHVKGDRQFAKEVKAEWVIGIEAD